MNLSFDNICKQLKQFEKKFNSNNTTIFERYAILKAIEEMGQELIDLSKNQSPLYKEAIIREIKEDK